MAADHVPVAPTQAVRQRDQVVASLRAGVEVPLKVAGVVGGAPADAGRRGAQRDRDRTGRGRPPAGLPVRRRPSVNISNINYVADETVDPNAVVTPVDDQGRICLRSHRDTDVAVDFAGYFTEDGGLDFLALDPIRLFDSRSDVRRSQRVDHGRADRRRPGRPVEIAGERGVPARRHRPSSVNLTATDATSATYLTVYPCGTAQRRRTSTSSPHRSSRRNGAMVKLSARRRPVRLQQDRVHLIVDINGVWRVNPGQRFTGSAVQVRIGDPGSIPHGVDGVAGEDRTPAQHPAALPVRQTQARAHRAHTARRPTW